MKFINKSVEGDNIRPHAIDGKCVKCGQCCGLFVPVTNEELATIKKYVKKHNIKPVTDRQTIMGFEARCCFYDKKNKKCNIYPVRPWVCRDFMCDRKDWKEKRNNEYDTTGDYNSTKCMRIGTFDDLIYGNLEILVQYVSGTLMDNLGYADDKELVLFLMRAGRSDILPFLEFGRIDGTKVKATDLQKELLKEGRI